VEPDAQARPAGAKRGKCERIWLMMLSPIRTLSLSAPTDYLAGYATFDTAQGTLTPQYVAREIQKTLPVSYLKVQRYAERNADKLKAKAKFEKERGFNTNTLE
jgi:hypothetical protein